LNSFLLADNLSEQSKDIQKWVKGIFPIKKGAIELYLHQTRSIPTQLIGIKDPLGIQIYSMTNKKILEKEAESLDKLVEVMDRWEEKFNYKPEFSIKEERDTAEFHKKLYRHYEKHQKQLKIYQDIGERIMCAHKKQFADLEQKLGFSSIVKHFNKKFFGGLHKHIPSKILEKYGLDEPEHSMLWDRDLFIDKLIAAKSLEEGLDVLEAFYRYYTSDYESVKRETIWFLKKYVKSKGDIKTVEAKSELSKKLTNLYEYEWAINEDKDIVLLEHPYPIDLKRADDYLTAIDLFDRLIGYGLSEVPEEAAKEFVIAVSEEWGPTLPMKNRLDILKYKLKLEITLPKLNELNHIYAHEIDNPHHLLSQYISLPLNDPEKVIQLNDIYTFLENNEISDCMFYLRDAIHHEYTKKILDEEDLTLGKKNKHRFSGSTYKMLVWLNNTYQLKWNRMKKP